MLDASEKGKGPSLGSFDWEDPFRLVDQLSEEERMVADAARAYAKALQQANLGGDVIGPTKQFVQSLRDAVMEGW